ncbi:MAG: 4-hydroxy-tetrahydrodipicolinate synthase [Candidatus Eremiobacteraeota bacterium]|nr:4-hydroxy-tetrahydrodipicolinate synthase [Candidatus Eremiobacteraeota bacterium]
MTFGNLLTAMITPFDADGALDVAESARIAAFLVERGNDGLIVAGSTGEGQTLSDPERNSLIASVKNAVAGRACVVANAGTNDTRTSVAAARAAQGAGADAILAVVPYYNKPTQSGMLAHFGAIADASDLPVIIYNIPGRTGTNMLPETLLELARRHDTILGVKESSGDLKQIATIARDRAPGFQLLCGDDHLFLPALAVGADGLIGVATHLCAREFRGMYEAFRAGRVADATKTHLATLDLIDALFSTTNPIAVKWAMRELGFAAGECRLPLDGMPAALAARLMPLIAPYR